MPSWAKADFGAAAITANAISVKNFFIIVVVLLFILNDILLGRLSLVFASSDALSGFVCKSIRNGDVINVILYNMMEKIQSSSFFLYFCT